MNGNNGSHRYCARANKRHSRSALRSQELSDLLKPRMAIYARGRRDYLTHGPHLGSLPKVRRCLVISEMDMSSHLYGVELCKNCSTR